MSVVNGQIANQTTFNEAFVSRKVDSDTVGRVGLKNVLPESGAEIQNAQRYINELADVTGVLNEGDATAKQYGSTNFIADGDDRKTAIGKLDVALAADAVNLSNHIGQDIAHGTGSKIVGESDVNLLTNKNISHISNTVLTVTGSVGGEISVTAAGGISIVGVNEEMIFVSGDSPDVVVTATPQVQAGTKLGQKLTLIGGPNTIILADGNGLFLNGICELNQNQVLDLFWNGSTWHEKSRRE